MKPKRSSYDQAQEERHIYVSPSLDSEDQGWNVFEEESPSLMERPTQSLAQYIFSAHHSRDHQSSRQRKIRTRDREECLLEAIVQREVCKRRSTHSDSYPENQKAPAKVGALFLLIS